MTEPGRSVVVFDVGGVLIDWDPRHLYRKLFSGDEPAMEHFLANVCTDKAELIDAYGARFDEMMPGTIVGAVEILTELRERGTPLYLLSNFSAETFPSALERFEFLRWFRGMVISGEVGVIKPDPRIYEIMLARYAIDPHRAVYIDDVAANAEAARPFGIHSIHFTTPAALREELLHLALL
jgi:2-haloacid dehalogenase